MRKILPLIAVMLLFSIPAAAQQTALAQPAAEPVFGSPVFGSPVFGSSAAPALPVSLSRAPLFAPTAACAGGPTIDGILLDECLVQSFTAGGTAKTITVWYTKNPVTATRMQDGTTYTLEHWINSDAEAQQVADWGQDAWERYWEIFGHHPYDTGCGNNINVRMEDGIGWSGIAYWADPGDCWIGIDSPTIRGGGGQWTVYHEFQHYLQYSYDDGCYGFLRPNYDSGSAAGDAEFVEGYADLGADSVDATLDSTGYGGNVYNPSTSMYDKSYGNRFNKYFIEQLGSLWTPADPQHHMDALRDHYEECDNQDTLYVMDTLIPSLRPGASEESFFMDFFAANWAKDWADPVTQPALVYTDDNGNPYGSIALEQNVSMSSGSQSWNSQSTPDDWAGKYYQVRPQTGCDYVTLNVDGAAGADLGINLMAADTSGATSVQRAAWVGEDFVRTFPGAGVYDKLVAAVNSFAANATYDVSATCVTPVLNILEPRQTNFALVGDPASPISFLARFEVTSGGAPVLGLVEGSFTADAEGDAVTIVPGSFQQVGEEYWAVLLPPTKPAGTTFVDLKICLDGTVCDTETNALLYVDPGNTDFALVFDASGSMDTEDIPGEGKRIDNAKKAGTVLADLLRVGDRVLVTDFSATDDPPGCGLPGGDGNCPLDIRQLLAREDVVDPPANAIADTKAAIDLITPRAWTPIGGALRDGKDRLTAAPTGENPKHLVLLSDGEENVNPLYADVRTEIIDSGVVVDTIGFSFEAGQTLLAQIAADTGGTYRFVPTTPGTYGMVDQADREQAAALGLPDEMVQRITTENLPGPLGLDNVYDYFETKSQSAARLFHSNFTGKEVGFWQYAYQYVDDSVNTLRLVVGSKQPDIETDCNGYYRAVEVLMPGGGERDWIPISPPDKRTPPEWDIRNSLYDDVVIIPKPAQGVWGLRSTLYYCIPAGGEAPEQVFFDVMMNGSAETNLQLQGRFLAPIENNLGKAGDSVPIVAALLDRTGAVPGALVGAIIEKPGGTDVLLLLDDGAHSDGAAGDGIYGNFYNLTTVGGTYNVRIVSFLLDTVPEPDQWITREWLGGFWIDGPAVDDGDKDGMPDPWEKRCKLDTGRNDSEEDLDRDGLTNIAEYFFGTLPCDSDTDNGGERDGSEINNGRNPLWGRDDLVHPFGHLSVVALNQLIVVRWTHPISYTNVIGYLSLDPGDLGQGTDMGNSGVYTFTGVTNDLPYYVTLAGMNGGAEGKYSEPEMVVPKADPDAPSGAVLINDGASGTNSKQVVLNITSTDTPLDGLAESANAHLGGPMALKYNEVSAGIQMRISNYPSFPGAAWEPLAAEKPWTLKPGPGGTYAVYVQFKDAAENESYVVYDEIVYITIYLPVLER